MKRLAIFAMLMCVLAVLPSVALGETVDRVIAIVYSTPILLSDWEQEWRCEALLAGRDPASYTDPERRDVFNRLVDQELLREQMKSSLLSPLPPGAVEGKLQDLRKQLSASTDIQWREMLKSAGVTEQELTDYLRKELEAERLVNSRFRSAVRIDERMVARYYNDHFLPELRRAGGKDVPLEEVSGRIREILVQQTLTEELNSWLQSLREQAEIQFPPAITTQVTSEVTQTK